MALFDKDFWGPFATLLMMGIWIVILARRFLKSPSQDAEESKLSDDAGDTKLIKSYIDELLQSFGRVTPPVNADTLARLHGRKDYAAMLGWIKNSMGLDLRVGLRIVDSIGPSAPMWIETPRPMPAYGTEQFRRVRVIVNAWRDVLETKPFGWIVAGFAHELSHVVLFATGHALQHEEKAVDLTAMILGFQNFVVEAEKIEANRKEWFGYLTTGERQFARQYLRQVA